MIWRLKQIFGTTVKSAMLCVALFVFATASSAEDITIRSLNGALELTGAMIGYDGEYLQIDTTDGPLSLIYDQVVCTGAKCPDKDNYIPKVRFSGSGKIAEVLMPAMVEGYARSQGLAVSYEPDEPSQVVLLLLKGDQPFAEFYFRSTTSEEGFTDLIVHETDIAISTREVRVSENSIAAETGIGPFDAPNQSRIVGLDGLVPIVSPRRSIDTISLENVRRAFRGEITDWSDFESASGSIELHLGPENSGSVQAIVEFLSDSGPLTEMTFHDDNQSLTDTVAANPNALGMTSFLSAGASRAVAISDACGFVTSPNAIGLKTEDFPLVAPIFLYLPKRRQPVLVRDFLEWVRTPAAQLIVRRSGFIDQGVVPISLDAQGQRFANAIERVGAEVPIEELQRFVRLVSGLTRLSVSFRFDDGSSRLDTQSRSNIFDLAHAVRDGKYAGRMLKLIGFSDGQGDATENRDLSAARAEAVRLELNRLLGTQMPQDVEISIEAFGEALPLACDDTAIGRGINRRVELWISD